MKRLKRIKDVPVISRYDDVHSCTGLTDVGSFLVVHFTQRVGEGAGSVNDTFGTNVELLPCERQHEVLH